MSARLETSEGEKMLTCDNYKWKEENFNINGMFLKLPKKIKFYFLGLLFLSLGQILVHFL